MQTTESTIELSSILGVFLWQHSVLCEERRHSLVSVSPGSALFPLLGMLTLQFPSKSLHLFHLVIYPQLLHQLRPEQYHFQTVR